MRFIAQLMVALLAFASLALAAVELPVLGKPVTGKIQIQGIDVLRFAPQGVLLVADGKGGQIVAIDTQDSKPVAGAGARIDDLAAQIAAKLGAKATDVEVIDMAVNPLSRRAYIAVRKHDSKSDLIITIDPAGKIDFLPLQAARHVRLELPKTGSPATAVRISDLAWAGGRLVASARSNEEFASKILVIPGPLSE